MKSTKVSKETIRDLGIVKRDFPTFNVGDTIVVAQRIKEGDKERVQTFEGDVIKIQKNGASSTFTVRRIGANSVSVERIFPFYSPLIDSIKFIRNGDVCRAKLYYMRNRVGKEARVQEKIMSKEDRKQGGAQ